MRFIIFNNDLELDRRRIHGLRHVLQVKCATQEC